MSILADHRDLFPGHCSAHVLHKEIEEHSLLIGGHQLVDASAQHFAVTKNGGKPLVGEIDHSLTKNDKRPGAYIVVQGGK